MHADCQGSVPAWGSYLYSNFLLPAFSPSEWLNSNTPSAGVPTQQTTDYFNSQAPRSTASQYQMPESHQQAGSYAPQRASTNPLPYSHPMSGMPGPSTYFSQPYYQASSIPTSLLVSQPSSSDISPSVDVIDAAIVNPSPSPTMHSINPTPHASPKHRGAKRRASSMDSADSHDDPEADQLAEHEHDIAEGVERDGMIWGMKVEDYRALSARERKRVRNRISARTFRAKRKEHLSSLESTLNSKDLEIKLAHEENLKLKRELIDLKRRLAQYEGKPY